MLNAFNLNIALGLLLLISCVLLLTSKNNFNLIAYFSMFSFIAASLYYINAAPDIALAEIAIGCAFIPLIFTITIARQNTFIVLFFSQENQEAYCDPQMLLEFMALAESFCDANGLKFKILTKSVSYTPDLRGIFRPGNIDILADYDESRGILTLIGNKKNKLIPEFENAMRANESIRFNNAGGSIYED